MSCAVNVTHLYELAICLIHLAKDAGRVPNKVFDGVHVVEGDEQNVLWPWTQEDLILESHGHQVIELVGQGHRDRRSKDLQLENHYQQSQDKTWTKTHQGVHGKSFIANKLAFYFEMLDVTYLEIFACRIL